MPAAFSAHGVVRAFGDEVAAGGPAPTMFAAAMPVRARKIERLLRRAAARIAVGEQLRIRPSDHFALAPAGPTARATIPAGDAAAAVGSEERRVGKESVRTSRSRWALCD